MLPDGRRVAWLERLLDLVAPRRCLGCDVVGDAPWCSACGEPRPLAADERLNGVPLIALGAYEGPLARAIKRLKYERRSALAGPLARELARVLLHTRPAAHTVFVPVPLHPRRLAERGFNQSALLARALARRAGGDFRPCLLARVRETDQQAELDYAERQRNVACAFRVRGRPPARVMVVDDVVTTGATVDACVQVLHSLHVEVVAILALARTPGRIRIS